MHAVCLAKEGRLSGTIGGLLREWKTGLVDHATNSRNVNLSASVILFGASNCLSVNPSTSHEPVARPPYIT